MEIRFDYEYDCGGYTHSKTVNMGKDEFENDTLLILVCSYMQTRGYPGKDIDMYLHNKFPEIHTLDDMYGQSIYNVYDCHVEGLKPFYDIADIMLSMSPDDAEKEIIRQCREFNAGLVGTKKNMSIWEDY